MRSWRHNQNLLPRRNSSKQGWTVRICCRNPQRADPRRPRHAHHPRPDHAAYIAPWLQVLKDDPRAIFTAASKAQQAADWMWAQQPQPMAIAA